MKPLALLLLTACGYTGRAGDACDLRQCWGHLDGRDAYEVTRCLGEPDFKSPDGTVWRYMDGADPWMYVEYDSEGLAVSFKRWCRAPLDR